MGCRLNYPTMACDSPASNVSIESKLLGYSLLYWQYARTDLDEILAVPSFIVRVVETIMVCSLSCSKFQVSCTLRMAILKLCLPVVGFFGERTLTAIILLLRSEFLAYCFSEVSSQFQECQCTTLPRHITH